MKKLNEVAEEAAKCVGCGKCKSVCPSYNVRRREGVSPRGRVALIKSRLGGEEDFAEAYVRDIKDCTLCASCFSNCPNEVNVPRLVLAARAESAERDGLPLIASIIYKTLLSSGNLMNIAVRTASIFTSLVLKEVPLENGLVSRFSLPLIGDGRLVPELAKVPFLELESVREYKSKDTSSRMGKGGKVRVAFFAGCGVNYIMPGVGEATLKLLEECGAEVFVPQGQHCCGMPALAGGDRATARKNALSNLEAFEAGDFDYITTSCATCSHALKKHFVELLKGESEELSERVERFSDKVLDVTVLLHSVLGYGEGQGKNKDKNSDSKGTKVATKSSKVVTWHDPCHLSRYLGAREEPRELLQKSSYTFKGMKNPCKCCGLGGGLAYTNYELSREISRVKALSIMDSGADIVATACPGCIVQLRDALHRYGPGSGKDKDNLPRVVHIVEIL